VYRIALGLTLAIAAAVVAWRLFEHSEAPTSRAMQPAASTATASSALARGEMVNFTLYAETKPVPEFSVEDRDGRKLGLAAFRGKVILVNFWATWCGPCVREMPSLARLQAGLGSDDFEVVAIASDRGGWSAVNTFLKDQGIDKLTVLLDQNMRASRAVGVFGLPTTLLIDRQGRELGRMTGPAEWDGADARRLIAAVLDGSVGDGAVGGAGR